MNLPWELKLEASNELPNRIMKLEFDSNSIVRKNMMNSLVDKAINRFRSYRSVYSIIFENKNVIYIWCL